MKLCIAEKPSVAREIANLLQIKKRQDGYYEGSNYCVTWTFGHLCSLQEPNDYRDQWAKWKIDDLPMLPDKFHTKVKNDKGIKKQFNVIKKLVKKADIIINCGDAGQEGELIQRWVLKEANNNKPVKRLWISSLTTEAMKAGFKNLKDGEEFDYLYYAGMCRAVGDWILGMNATRLYTMKYGTFGTVLSVGRVQTPTLAMIVKRHHEIENFVSEPFWELETAYEKTIFKYKKGRFTKLESAEQIFDKIKAHELKITDFTRKPGKEYAPKLFDLTALQVHCNKRFGLKAEMTLKIAQSLYEKKFISYPRVDTSYLPNDQYKEIPKILKGLSAYNDLIQPLWAEALKKSSRVFNDKKVTDHHAIIPTGKSPGFPSDIDRNSNAEHKVYDAITRRFIANFYPDCEVSKTNVLAAVNEEIFHANGKEIVKEGWRKVIKIKEKKDNEKTIPSFVKGEEGPHKPKILTKKTQPPKHYTEATLLRAMETAGKQVDDDELREMMKENGIGRPSTRAAIIEILFKRNYLVRKAKNIHPTQTGIQLIAVIKNELLKSPELTGQWEKKLRYIEKKQYNPTKFVNEMKSMISQIVHEVRMDNSSVKIDAPVKKRRKTYKKKAK